MKNVRVVIVDDSPFSLTIERGILEDNGFEVVGTAGNLEEVKEVVAETKPDVVTMDMTMPGTDGFACTKAVHEIDPNIKVIMVSSMLDAELLQKAKEYNILSYVQKPIDEDELITAIEKAVTADEEKAVAVAAAVDESHDFFQTEYFEVFKESLKNAISRMTKTPVTCTSDTSDSEDYVSEGVTVVIGIIGKFPGRLLFGLTKETASKIATAALKGECKGKDDIITMLGELSNIVSGNTCSALNNRDNALGLRVAPPTVLFGAGVTISKPSFPTMTTHAETDFGRVIMEVGFKWSDER